MADLSVTPVSTGIKPQPQMSLADLMNISQNALAYNQAQQINPLKLQEAQLQLQQAQAMNPLAVQEAQAKVRSATTSADVAEAIKGFTIGEAGSKASRAATEAESTAQDLATKQHQKIANEQIGLMNDALVIKAEQNPNSLTPDEKNKLVQLVTKTGQTIGKNIGLKDNLITQLNQPYVDLATSNPQGLRAYIKERHIAGLDGPARTAALTPSGIAVDTGQQTYTSNTNPFAATGEGQIIPGSLAQKELPPTTPIMQGTTPGYLGPQRKTQAAAPSPDAERNAILQNELKDAKAAGRTQDVISLEREISRNQGNRGFVASGLPVGAEESIKGNVGEMNTHFSGLNTQAAQLPRTNALVSNIKSLVPNAITGTEQGRKAYVNGLLDSFGLGNQKTNDMQTKTNLLEKYLADLNLQTPAASDAARTLISAARPHGTMDKQSIIDAAEALNAQIKASAAVRDTLTTARNMNDPTTYQAQRSRLEQIVDPRIWQLQGKSAAEQRAFMQKLSPQDRADLINKAKQLETYGVLK